MADRKPAFAEVALNVGGQFQQAQSVGHHGAALADFGRDFLLRELELLDELGVTLGFFDGIEVLALEVLDERQFQHGAVVGLAEDDRHLGQAEQLGRPPAAFARNQLQPVVAFAHDKRLHNALFLDRVGQFAKGFGGKILARLKGQGGYGKAATRWTRSRGHCGGGNR